jgi:hypothetical protein
LKALFRDIVTFIWQELRWIIFVPLWICGAFAFFAFGPVTGFSYLTATMVFVYFGNSYREKHQQYEFDQTLSVEAMERAKEEFIGRWKKRVEN